LPTEIGWRTPTYGRAAATVCCGTIVRESSVAQPASVAINAAQQRPSSFLFSITLFLLFFQTSSKPNILPEHTKSTCKFNQEALHETILAKSTLYENAL